MPPLVFPRSIQIARTLKTLRARGWTTHVVTIDPNRVKDPVCDQRFASVYAREYTLHPIDILSEEGRRERIFDRKSRWEAPVNKPEDNAWLRRAARQADRLLRRRGFDALVTFVFPPIDHAVGLELVSRRARLPWIAHFSDPVVDSPYVQAQSRPEQLTQWAAEERAVVERADALVFTTRQTADLVMSKYPADLHHKVFVVPHGYDADLLAHIAAPPRRERLHVVHTGNLYGLRDARAFLRAVARLNDDSAMADCIEVTFAGNIAAQDCQLATDLGIAHRANFLGRLPYLEALQVAASADVLLVIDAPDDVGLFLLSKISDYFLFKKPILGLTPREGATADVLRRCGHDVAPPADEEAIAEALRTLVQRWKAGRLEERVNQHEMEAFDIRKTSAEFERAILAAIKRRGRR
jgi:glycosyltransferase involved in cell wall biosynthesis